MGLSDFIKKARNIHGDKYDYSKSLYLGSREKIEIICPLHGSFFQLATNHLSGKGCKECSKIQVIKNQSSNTEDFINKARNVHGERYYYSLVDYINNHTKVEIICKEHGKFLQSPKDHLSGKGCPYCGKERSNEDIKSRMMLSRDEFINRANEVHGERYDYSLVDYLDTKTKVEIICKEHGSFLQTPNKHMQGRGCPSCGRERTIEHNFLTLDDFIKRARNVHGNRYDYSDSIYTSADSKMKIICEKHGKFLQTPHNHLKGTNCPSCGASVSKPEIKLKDFIRSFYKGEIITNSKNIIPPMELDIYVPTLNLAIEFNGGYWHSERFKDKNYHLHKYNLCKEKGIRLVSIWEWEYLKDRDKIENFIKNLILEKKKFFARKLNIKEVDINTQREFLDINHLQGYIPCTLALGLYKEDELVQLMTLRVKSKKDKLYEIGRLATKTGFTVVGGSKRLFKHLLSFVDFETIISYNNMDKFTGDTYESLGMIYESISIPYGWIRNLEYLPRYATQKSKLIRQGFDKNLSESEIMRSEGFEKIYFTGVSKFVLKKESLKEKST